jgi:hypothetical protein
MSDTGSAWPGDRWPWYEAYVAALAALRGYTPRLTPPHDWGADILLYRGPQAARPVWAIQCKAYQDPVGVEAVQAIYAAVRYYEAEAGIVVCPRAFTDGAQQLAGRLGVQLHVITPLTVETGWQLLPLAFTDPPAGLIPRATIANIALQQASPVLRQEEALRYITWDGVEATGVVLGWHRGRWVYIVGVRVYARTLWHRQSKGIWLLVFDAVTGNRLPFDRPEQLADIEFPEGPGILQGLKAGGKED